MGVGAVVEVDLVWILGDICNALMALPNLLGIIGLTRQRASAPSPFRPTASSLTPTAYSSCVCCLAICRSLIFSFFIASKTSASQ